MNATGPKVSIVVPIHNEEAILHAAVIDLRERLMDVPYDWELLLAENGSTDATLEVAKELSRKLGNLRILSVPEPNYGRALREGILAATGEIVICEEIDLCDTVFHARALELLANPEINVVIGSKLLAGASDERPLTRHAASQLYSTMLRLLLGFKGTDTHGLKALRRKSILPIVRACVVDRDVFASELVIRAERAHLKSSRSPCASWRNAHHPSISLPEFRKSSRTWCAWPLRFDKIADLSSNRPGPQFAPRSPDDATAAHRRPAARDYRESSILPSVGPRSRSWSWEDNARAS
ncbi:MAG: glycosyltransferase family 2 protein [Polyangiaceae bacterium]